MEQKDFVKLANSLYKILDFLPESDPLKNKAKEKVLAVMENAVAICQVPGWMPLKQLLSGESQNQVAVLLGDIEILQNYLAIGKGQGWISPMNFFIIDKEYGNLKSFFRERFSVHASPVLEAVKTAAADSQKTPAPGPVAIKQQPKASYSVRQVAILSILGKRPKTQVADLIKELPDITKRTIRRDLDELLKKGEIRRQGRFNEIFYQLAR